MSHRLNDQNAVGSSALTSGVNDMSWSVLSSSHVASRRDPATNDMTKLRPNVMNKLSHVVHTDTPTYLASETDRISYQSVLAKDVMSFCSELPSRSTRISRL